LNPASIQLLKDCAKIADMKSMHSGFKKISGPVFFAAIVAVVIVALFIYSYMRIFSLANEVNRLSIDLASTTALLSEKTALLDTELSQIRQKTLGLSDTLSVAEQKIQSTKESVETVQSQVSGVEQEVGNISGTVTTLEKLAKADPELLQKYSKVYFLNEHYVPERFSEIDKRYLYSEDNPELIHSLVWPRLKALLDAAKNAGVELYVKSGYRSFDEQKYLKSEYAVTYGEGTANQFSADQGYSEHQLGTTVDFITTGLGGQLDGFEKTKAYQWMIDNAYRYGFVLSYPDENGYYIFEPWHWRYVGIGLATFLRNENKYFYDLDQRKIDEYLVNMFD